MCRLLGYAAARPSTVADLIGGTDTRVFRDMARLHRDGWGTASRAAEGPIDVVQSDQTAIDAMVSPVAGAADPLLTSVLRDQPALARIVHLRLATDGMACAAENTHPFVADGMAFAHNGSIQPNAAIEELVSAERLAAVMGTTDSERYFAAIRTAMDDGADAVDAVVETVRALRDRFPGRSLNALLLTRTELIAVHASEHAPIPHATFAASGLPRSEWPRNHEDAYYLMRSKRTADGSVLFASSGLDIAGWRPLAPESVTAVDLTTRMTRSIALRERRPSRVA